MLKNKKVFKYIFSVIVLMILFVPVYNVLGATSIDTPQTYISGADDSSLEQNSRQLSANNIINIINIVLAFVGLVTVIMLLVGVFKHITGQGSDTKLTEAKSTIKNSIIGLVIILLIGALIKLVISVVV